MAGTNEAGLTRSLSNPLAGGAAGLLSSFSKDKAMNWAFTAGTQVASAKHWVETEGIKNRTFTTLGVAFGLGVFTGWLIKRR